MATQIINEGSSLYLTLTFFDELSVPITPSSAKWRIDEVSDPHTPVEVTAWTVLGGLASTMAVNIPGTSNAISDQADVFEPREFTILINEGLGTQASQKKFYRIKNLIGVS